MALFTNQASITYNGGSAKSNIVTGNITQVMSIGKNATYKEYHVGDILTYVINIRNSGAADYDTLTVTDNLGAYTHDTKTLVPLTHTGDPVLFYINGVSQAQPSVSPGPPLEISGISVPAGGTGTVIYRVFVNSYAPLSVGGKIDNIAELSGGGLSEKISAVETVTAVTDPSLSILKALNPTTVLENGRLTYTFIIQNSGAVEADAAAEIVIADTFKPPLGANIDVTLNGAAWPAAGNYSYNAGTGEFSTVEGRVTVPAAVITQDTTTGVWSTVPGVTTLTVTGTI